MEINKSLIKGLLISNIILIILLFGSNIAWLIYESQFEKVTETDTQTVENIDSVRDIIQGDNN